MSNLSCFIASVLVFFTSQYSFAYQQESPQDSLILLKVQNHIDNAEYYAARSSIIKILKEPHNYSQIHQTLEFDLLSKYIEASIYVKRFDFDSMFIIPAVLKETTVTLSYLNVLAFHSLIPLLKGNISEFNNRYEYYIRKCLILYDWNKSNARMGQHRIFNFAKAIDNITVVLENNNYMNELEIVLKQYAEIIAKQIDKDNWGYTFNMLQLATYLNNIGLIKQAISINKEALVFSTQPNVIKEDSGIPYTAYANLTSNNMEINNFKEASCYADSAFSCIEVQHNNFVEYIRTFMKMIYIHTMIGNYRKVQWAKKFSDSITVINNDIIDKYIDREYASSRAIGQSFLLARSNYYYGNYLFNINSLDSAEYYYHKSLMVFQANNTFDYLLREKNTYMKLGWLYVVKGDAEKAEKYFNLALSDDKELLKNVFAVLSDYQKEMFFPLLHSDYDQYNNYLLSNITQSDSAIIKLINTRLNIKSILLTNANFIKRNSTAADDSMYSTLHKNLISTNDELSRVYIKSLKNKKDSQKYIDSLEIASLDYERLLTILKNKNMGSNLSFNSDWESIKRILKPHEAAIEIIHIPRYGFYPNTYNPNVKNFSATDSGYYCAVIIKSTSAQPEYVLSTNSTVIDGVYDKYYRKAIYISKQDVINKDIPQLLKESKDNLRKAYSIVWKEIDHKLTNITKLYISNDGIYNKINPNILIDGKGTYNVDKYNIEIVTSLNRLLSPPHNELPAHATIALFGNPDFDNTGKDTVYDNNSIENISVATLRGDNQLDKKWKNLKQTNAEIENINSIFAKSKCTIHTFTKELASENNLKNISQPTILHIATHGYFLQGSNAANSIHNIENNSTNLMMNSGLIMAGANINNEHNESLQDGILTASEASRLDLNNTQLVVLSACETGLGEVKNGEGVYGLQRAFLLAGADNLMMSLWKVDDLATKELMVHFYKNYSRNNNPTLSLKKAQQTLRRNKKFEHPMFWGGFVVVR